MLVKALGTQVMGVAPIIQSRVYSIASASEKDRVSFNPNILHHWSHSHYDQVSLVVGVVEDGLSKDKEEVGLPPTWKGLCSGQLLTAEVTLTNIIACSNPDCRISARI